MGMHCESCAKLIEMEFEGKVNSIKVSKQKEEAVIDFNEHKITESEIKSTILKLGYKIIERG